MSRKIVQISAAGVNEGQGTQCEMFIVALCDDGSVWVCDNREWGGQGALGGNGWMRIAAIPQGND